MVKVYKGWAMKKNEDELRDLNFKSFKELIEKYKVGYGEGNGLAEYIFFDGNNLKTKECKFSELQVSFDSMPPTYAEIHAKVILNKPNLSSDELLLLFDDGNLCFGGRAENDILTVYTD